MSVPAEGRPEFIMTGFTKPDGRVRLYASRHVKAPTWDQRELSEGWLWHIEGDLDEMLIIDAMNWTEAYTRLFAIWANQDKARWQRHELPGQAVLPGGPKPLTGPATA